MDMKENAKSFVASQKDIFKERRSFFQKGIALSVAAVATGNLFAEEGDPNILKQMPWQKNIGNSGLENKYGQPSIFERKVLRKASKECASGSWATVSALCPLQDLYGIITPNGLFFTRSHSGIAQIDPKRYRLMIHGLVEKPIVLTLEELKRYPRVSRIHFIECSKNGSLKQGKSSLQEIKGMMSCAEWNGVYLKDIIKDLGLKPTAKWMLAEGSDNSAMARTIPVDKVLDDVMIVYGQNGEALRAEQGYPVRLLVPGWEGGFSIKWLKRLEFATEPFFSKEDIEHSVLKPNAKAIQSFYPMEVNSVITSPCPEHPWDTIKDGEWVEIEGVAWSGQGTVKGVDISFDGGKNWTKATLKGLVLPKAWTRFSLMYRFKKGEKLLLCSRAYDDAGFIQPTFKQEMAFMKVDFFEHNNTIFTWEVTKEGKVKNVQVIS